jgi:hypothetical protein
MELRSEDRQRTGNAKDGKAESKEQSREGRKTREK